MLVTFYNAVKCLVLSVGGGNISKLDRGRLEKIVKTTTKNRTCYNRSGRCLLPRTNTNCYKASFLPSALSVFNENYTSRQLSVRMRQDIC